MLSTSKLLRSAMTKYFPSETCSLSLQVSTSEGNSNQFTRNARRGDAKPTYNLCKPSIQEKQKKNSLSFISLAWCPQIFNFSSEQTSYPDEVRGT